MIIQQPIDQELEVLRGDLPDSFPMGHIDWKLVSEYATDALLVQENLKGRTALTSIPDDELDVRLRPVQKDRNGVPFLGISLGVHPLINVAVSWVMEGEPYRGVGRPIPLGDFPWRES